MNMIIRFTILGLGVLLCTACSHSPENVTTNREIKDQLLQEIRAMPVKDWEQPVWQHINRSTSVVMTNVGDSVTGEKKEELTKIVRGYFVEDMKVRRSRYLVVQNEDYSRNQNDLIKIHRDLRLMVVSNTMVMAKQLLDSKGYRQFQKSLDPFIPKTSESRTGDNSTRYLERGFANRNPLNVDGTSRWDGRAGK